MKFRDNNILYDLIFDFYTLLNNLLIDNRIPLSAKCIILNKNLKKIKKEYKEFIKYDICSR